MSVNVQLANELRRISGQNTTQAQIMLALGYTGLGETEKGKRYLHEVEQLDINHQGIMALKTLLH